MLLCFVFNEPATTRIYTDGHTLPLHDSLPIWLVFGRSAHMHRRHVFENDRALLIEIVDDDATLRSFAVALDDIPDIGLMTLEPVEILGGKAKQDRKSVGEGKRVSVRVELGGRRSITTQRHTICKHIIRKKNTRL